MPVQSLGTARLADREFPATLLEGVFTLWTVVWAPRVPITNNYTGPCMGSEKRARQKKNRQARLEAERRAARQTKWRRRIVRVLVIAVVVVVVFVIGNLLTGPDEPGGQVTVPEPPAVTDTTTAPSDG